MPRDLGLHRWRLYLEEYAGQAGKLVEGLKLTKQAFLLIAQASGPVAVCHDQQQTAFAPRGNVAMLPRGWLKLAFEQALQVCQALGMAENSF